MKNVRTAIIGLTLALGIGIAVMSWLISEKITTCDKKNIHHFNRAIFFIGVFFIGYSIIKIICIQFCDLRNTKDGIKMDTIIITTGYLCLIGLSIAISESDDCGTLDNSSLATYLLITGIIGALLNILLYKVSDEFEGGVIPEPVRIARENLEKAKEVGKAYELAKAAEDEIAKVKMAGEDRQRLDARRKKEEAAYRAKILENEDKLEKAKENARNFKPIAREANQQNKGIKNIISKPQLKAVSNRQRLRFEEEKDASPAKIEFLSDNPRDRKRGRR